MGLPAATQNCFDRIDKPAGIFAEISDADGTLSIVFKRMVIDQSGRLVRVDTMTDHDILKYHRYGRAPGCRISFDDPRNFQRAPEKETPQRAGLRP